MKAHVLETPAIFLFFENDRPKGSHIDFSIKKFFNNISETIHWISFYFAG
jgi:hypothetical protein